MNDTKLAGIYSIPILFEIARKILLENLVIVLSCHFPKLLLSYSIISILEYHVDEDANIYMVEITKNMFLFCTIFFYSYHNDN